LKSSPAKQNDLDIRMHNLSKLAIDMANILFIVLDEEANILQFNNYAEKLTGYQSAEVLRKNWFDIFIPHYNFEKNMKLFKELLNTVGANNENENIIICKDKSSRLIRWNNTIVRDRDEKNILLLAIGVNITQQKFAEAEIRKQGAMLRSVIDATPDLIYYKDYKDQQGRYIGCNRAYEIFVGYTEAEMFGQTDIDIFGPEIGNAFRTRDLKMLASGETFTYDEWITYPDGRKVLLQTIKTPFYGANHEIRGVLGIGRDITDRWEAEQTIQQQSNSLKYQAYHDALTGLPNRVLLNDRLAQAISKAKRSKTNVAVLFIDLDRFKQINDSLGHHKGDEVLRHIASRLKKSLREGDTIARIGGDEFVVLMESLNRVQHATVMAKKIIHILQEPLVVENSELYVTSSIGISLYPQDGSDSQTLLKNSDAAMYKAKEEGRNTFQYYTKDMTKMAFERVRIEANLRRALKNEELVVYYQPQINQMTGKIIGFEALVRWRDPNLGLISPAHFIPLAEETGLIIPLGERVLLEALLQVKKWSALGLQTGRISVNISAKQLQQENFFKQIRQIIDDNHCDPEKLVLEITEGYVMKNPEHSIILLDQFKSYGIKLAIDDFGTGYSSLAYLKRLPIDKLKIDQSFIQDIPDDSDDAAITRAVVALAKSLNMNVIAEGVETKEQIDFLKETGCEEIQGYYYGKPLPADEATEFLKSWGRSK